MNFLKVVVLLTHVTSLLNMVRCEENVSCQNFKFMIDEDVVHDHVLEGHVFMRLTVSRATQCHVACKDDCRCVSMNYFLSTGVNNCELNDANKEMEPAAMKRKQGVNYYDLVRSYSMTDGKEFLPGKHGCVNRCCRYNPCMNGGVCEEICDPQSVRFNCTCTPTHTGKLCEIKRPKSCKEVAVNSGNLTSGKYVVYDSANQEFSVYCDMDSEPGFIWTLVQSFSLKNADIFRGQRFGINLPLNFDSRSSLNVESSSSGSAVDWTIYRMPLLQMQSLADHSTHLRATCNFSTHGLKKTDYARAKLKNHDFFGTFSYQCLHYEFINIRGISCENCTAATKQGKFSSWTINSHKSKTEFGCDLDGFPGVNENEHNFGQYRLDATNSAHRCSSSSASTTQHWLGSVYSL